MIPLGIVAVGTTSDSVRPDPTPIGDVAATIVGSATTSGSGGSVVGSGGPSAGVATVGGPGGLTIGFGGESDGSTTTDGPGGSDVGSGGSTGGSGTTSGQGDVSISFDADTAAFLTASGITDPTQSAALDALVVSLKGFGLWTLLDAIWPLVGGTASRHKWNLKDPRDLDAAFRLSFNGSWVHDANGIMPDHTTTWADTHYDPSAHMSASNGSLGYYSRTDITGVGVPNYDMGCSTAGDLRATIIVCRYHSGLSYLNFGTMDYPNTPSPDGRGLFVTSRASVTETIGYRNGAQFYKYNDAVIHPPFTFYLGGCNVAGTANYFGNKQCAFAFLGRGLTPTQHANLYSAIQTFQTSLGRNV